MRSLNEPLISRDIPVEMGELLYLEHSDMTGRRMEAEFSVKNAQLPLAERINAYNRNMREAGWISTNLVNMADRFKSHWLVADYEVGDMVIHSPYIIKTVGSLTRKQLRQKNNAECYNFIKGKGEKHANNTYTYS